MVFLRLRQKGSWGIFIKKKCRKINTVKVLEGYINAGRV